MVVLTRNPKPAPWRVKQWDGRTLGTWTSEIDGADAVVNLAGRSVNCRYGTKNRRQILLSRTESTRVIGQAIEESDQPPPLWMQMSTATIYADHTDAGNDEHSGIIGGEEPGVPEAWRFSIDVARKWEAAVDEALTSRTRKVILRTAMVMSPERGGTFDTLLTLVRLGLGGAAASGRQFVSWIHHADFVRAFEFLMKREDIEGVVNLAAPEPLPNREFMRVLRRSWGVPFGLPATPWMLSVGALAMRSETELILKSRRVVPGRLLEEGFAFEFADWPLAARDLCADRQGRAS